MKKFILVFVILMIIHFDSICNNEVTESSLSNETFNTNTPSNNSNDTDNFNIIDDINITKNITKFTKDFTSLIQVKQSYVELDDHQNIKSRKVSITMDNLALEHQDKILSLYKKYNVIGGFGAITSEDKNRYGEERTVDGIKKYFQEGHTVFNHTANHRSANRETFDEFVRDVKDGEKFINKAVTEFNHTQTKYFRFPYLDEGKNVASKLKIQKHLLNEGYIIAPITIDTMDWKFNIKYRNASKERKLVIGQEFLNHVKKVVIANEKHSNGNQILLIHSTKLTIDYLEDIIKIFANRGYTFISMDEALLSNNNRNINNNIEENISKEKQIQSNVQYKQK